MRVIKRRIQAYEGCLDEDVNFAEGEYSQSATNSLLYQWDRQAKKGFFNLSSRSWKQGGQNTCRKDH